MGFQHARAGELACRLCQSCKASSGKVDGVGLLGQAARSTSSADDRLRHRPCIPRPTASTYGQSSEIRFSSRITPKSTLQNSCCPFLNVTLSHPAYSPDLNPIEHALTLFFFFFFFISSYIACDLCRSWRLNLQKHILSTVRERLVVDPPCPPPWPFPRS